MITNYETRSEGRSMDSKKIYGYIRVSAIEQNEDRQLTAMRDVGIPQNHIFIDKQPGKDFNRL